MNLVRKVISLKAVALFFAGFLSVPTAAQEKIVPKHFREKPLGTAYSYRSATIGSTLVARRAGIVVPLAKLQLGSRSMGGP